MLCPMLPVDPEKPSLVSRFTRITTSGRFIPQIDGLRFIAIAVVVLYHMAHCMADWHKGYAYRAPIHEDWLYRISRHGHYGVQLFFIISGFILALPFAAHRLHSGKKVSLKAYFWRRITRLEPPYILCMLFFFALALVARPNSLVGMSVGDLLSHLGASLIYLHNVVFAEQPVLNIVAWSLEIEIQFYLLVPLLTVVFLIPHRMVRRGVLIAACVIAVALQRWLVPDGKGVATLTIAMYIQFFLMGFLLADIYLVDWRQGLPTTSGLFDVSSLICATALLVLCELTAGAGYQSGWGIATDFAFPLLLVVFCIGIFRGRLCSRLFSLPWITAIGGMCYTIYLLHLNFMLAFGKVGQKLPHVKWFGGDVLFQLAVFLPILAIACAAYFLLIERPCMDKNWPQKLMAKLRSKPKVELAEPATARVAE